MPKNPEKFEPKIEREESEPESKPQLEKEVSFASEPQLEEVRNFFQERLAEEEGLLEKGEKGAKEQIEYTKLTLEKLDRGSLKDLESVLQSFSSHTETLKNSIKMEEAEGEAKEEERIEELESLINTNRDLEGKLLEVLQKKEPTKELSYKDVIKFLQNPEEFDQEYKEEGEEELEVAKLADKFREDFQRGGVEGIEGVLNAINKRVEDINEAEEEAAKRGAKLRFFAQKQASRREHLRNLRSYLAEEFLSRTSEISEQEETAREDEETLERTREALEQAFKEGETKTDREKKEKNLAERLEKDPRFKAIKEELIANWEKLHGSRWKGSRLRPEFQDWQAGRGKGKQALEDRAKRVFRERFPEDAKAYEEREKKRIYESPDKDPAVEEIKEKILEWTNSDPRVEKIIKTGKGDYEKVWQSANLNASMRGWRMFADLYPEKAAAYSNQIELLGRILENKEGRQTKESESAEAEVEIETEKGGEKGA